MSEWKAFRPYNAAFDRFDFVLRKGHPGDTVLINGMVQLADAMCVRFEMIPLSSPGTPAWVNENVDSRMLQAIMDELWSTGMRPSGYVGTEQIGALKDHIADLRAIAFKTVGIENHEPG